MSRRASSESSTGAFFGRAASFLFAGSTAGLVVFFLGRVVTPCSRAGAASDEMTSAVQSPSHAAISTCVLGRIKALVCAIVRLFERLARPPERDADRDRDRDRRHTDRR